MGQGRGGDDTTVIDDGAERVAVARLEALEARGIGFLLVSEELGERRFGDPASPWIVVLDPDRRLAQRQARPAVLLHLDRVRRRADLDDVRFGFVKDFGSGEEWVAEAGAGSHRQRPCRSAACVPRSDSESSTWRPPPRHWWPTRRAAPGRARRPHPAVGRAGARAVPTGRRAGRWCGHAEAVALGRSGGGGTDRARGRRDLATVDGDVLGLDLDSRSRTVAARDPQWAETLRSLVYGDLYDFTQ